jgi:outer membrane protein TolC
MNQLKLNSLRILSFLLFFNIGDIIVTAQETKNLSLEALNPNSNLLYLPNKPEEVQLTPAQALTLDEVLNLAQQNNRELQITKETLQRSKFALKQAEAGLLPKLGAEIELSNGQDAKDVIDDLEDGNPSSTESPIDGKVGISYDIFTSGKRDATIKAAQEQVKLNQLEVQRIEKQVNLDVSLAYYDLQEADQLVRIAQVAVKNAELTLENAQRLEAGEVGSRFDVIRARVQLANAQQDLTNALTQQDIARRQLVELLSLNDSANIIPADPVQPEGKWDLSLEESIITAYQNRVELQQLMTEIKITDQKKRIALAQTQPQVSLFAGYQLRNDFESDIGLKDGYVVGTRLRWDFFDGGEAQAGASQEESNRLINETRFADVRNKIRFEIEKSYKTLQASRQNIETANFAYQQAQESLTLARLRFDSGVGILIDVLDAENELSRTDGDRVRAILNYNRAISQLEKALNLPTPNS